MRRVSAGAVVLALCSSGVCAQAAGDREAPQKGFEAFHAQVVRFREQAKSAFDREMVREKAGDCRDADSTRAIVDCLAKENETTTANYKAYVGALRSLLGIMGADGEDQTPGLTGRPLTSKELVKEFDATETAWQEYREAQCTAAFDQFKGGTAAVPEAGTCELMLVRDHLGEIEKIYHVRLHD